MRFLDGYATEISHYVNLDELKVYEMKSHDCHVFLQRVLPVIIRGLLKEDVGGAVTELCLFFQELCSRTLNIFVLKRMSEDIGIILCKLKMIFSPTFFTVMMHLAVHLRHEAMLAGPIQCR